MSHQHLIHSMNPTDSFAYHPTTVSTLPLPDTNDDTDELDFFDSCPPPVSPLSLTQFLMPSSPNPNADNQPPTASSAPELAPALKPSRSPWGEVPEGRSSAKISIFFDFRFRTVMMEMNLGILSDVEQSRLRNHQCWSSLGQQKPCIAKLQNPRKARERIAYSPIG